MYIYNIIYYYNSNELSMLVNFGTNRKIPKGSVLQNIIFEKLQNEELNIRLINFYIIIIIF